MSKPIEPIDPTEARVEKALAPVVYELGKALYIAQHFEMALLVLVAVVAGQDGKVTEQSFIAGLDTHAERTLGQLAKAFKSKLELPDGFEAFLRTGVEARNRVVHGFVMRNNKKFETKKGRAELIEELKDTQHVLDERLKFVFAALDRVLQGVGGGSFEELRAKADLRIEPD